jgi:hypothetical protein
MRKILPLAALVVSLACMPLATPMLTEQVPTPLVEITVPTSPSPEPAVVPTLLPSEPAPQPEPPSSPDVPVTLVLAGDTYSRDSLSLLGGYRDGAWLGTEQAADFIDINDDFRLYILDGLEQITQLASIQRDNGPAQLCSQPEYILKMDGMVLPLSVGLNSGWPAYPRPVEWLSSQNEFYLQAVAEYLGSAGLNQPQVTIQQVLRADLDGDGADEVLIAASRFVEPSGHAVSPGDYSLILMRGLVNGQVVTQPVISEVYFNEEPLAFPASYSVQGVLDVNADGRLEVLVHRQVWEGQGTILYELQDGRLREVLRQACGL